MAEGKQSTPAEMDLKEFCNLGYAQQCEKLPAHRRADSVRFSVANDARSLIRLNYSCELNHAPVEHGVLDYDCEARSWQVAHQDACIQRQAECYVETYLERTRIGAQENSC